MKQTLAIGVTIIGLIFFGYLFLNWVSTDTRTVEEIKVDKYKACLKYNNADYVEWCKNFIK